MKLGVQTYTVRKLIQTPQGIDEVFSKLSSYGVECVELARVAFTEEVAKSVAEAAKKYNILVPSIQIKYKEIVSDYATVKKVMQIIGAKYMSISVLDVKPVFKKDKAGILEFINKLNKLKEQTDKDGFVLCHHHHHFEFIKIDGELIFNMFINNFKGEFEFDTYWMGKSGINPVAMLDSLKGRVHIIHLRDLKMQLKPLKFDIASSDTEVGEGNIDFDAIIKKAKEVGIEYGYIEQSTKTPLESIKKSVDNLRKIGF